MIFGFNGNARMKTLAGALVLSMAAVATAHAGTLVGGGATLPAIGYTGDDVSHRLLTPQPGSLLGEYTAAGNAATSYCQTGSGAGKNILAGGTISGTSYNVQNTCPDSPTPTGFGAGQVGRSDLAQPNFAGADSPLALGDYNNYVANTTVHSGSFPVQFPAVGGAIAIAFNKSDSHGQLISLDLSDDQICKVFSGQTTTWAALTGDSSLTGNIQIVYRSDGSGTTFGFSNHLSAVCSGTTGTVAQHFVTDQAFTTVVSKFGLPAGANGQSGNPAVAAAIASTDGTIGYVEAANTVPPGAAVAAVNHFDPFNDFGNAALDVSSSVVYNSVINGANANTGRPVVSALSTLVTGAPTTQCIALVDPSSYAAPTSGYPIVAVSYFLANSAHNGADTSAVQNLLWAPYNSTITNNVFTIGSGTGLSFLNAGLSQSAVTGCVASM
jgi:phosphate transport system substrate-binding protein